MRASPQLSLFASDTTGDAAVWAEQLSRAFADPRCQSGFLELAESAVGACPGDSTVLTLAAAAALLDARPERALVFLKRISKRFSATPTDHLLQALALFQEGKRLAARGLLVRHELTELSAALRRFPGGIERMRWLEAQLAAIMDQAHGLPQRRQPAVARSKGKTAPASHSKRASRRVTPPAAPALAEIAAASLQPLARIDIDISFAAEVDLAPMLHRSRNCPSRRADGGDCASVSPISASRKASTSCSACRILTGVEPLWHQIETVRKVLKQFRGRVLLADEVGLGKTIEAGMVLKEYALRGMAERVLVLTPGLARRAMEGRTGDQVRLGFRDHA